MLDKLTRGFGHRQGRSRGFGFEEHKEFVTHMESEGSFFDHQARMRLPANHGRPPMAHMPVCDEEDSDSDEEDLDKMFDKLIGGIAGGIAGAIIGTVDGFARGVGICPESYQSCNRHDCEEHKKKPPANHGNGNSGGRRQKDRA